MEKLQKIVDDNIDQCYHNLETLCICFPARVSGSEGLERSLDYLHTFGKKSIPYQCCFVENVPNVPCWNRGEYTQEKCTIDIIDDESIFPKPFPSTRVLRVLANGMSVGTNGDMSADLVIVHDWNELQRLGNDGIKDKIVLFDFKLFTNYGDLARFRGNGANEAAKYGAKAVLIRSLAPNSCTSGAHTGSQLDYEKAKIPAATLSVEDTELLSRLSARGFRMKATLSLPCSQRPDTISRNLIFEIPGNELKDEVVIVGGHTDSWDCQLSSCQGAHDDGQGVVIAMEIVRILHEHGFKPKRTVRAVLFVDEEVRQMGAKAYAGAHAAEAHNIVAAIETDMGVGHVCGFGFTGTCEARELLRKLLQPLSIFGDVCRVDDQWNGNGMDITPLIQQHQVPGLLLRHDDAWWFQDYFHFHHSTADTIDHVDKDLLKQNLAVLLGTVWILANCDEKLPR